MTYVIIGLGEFGRTAAISLARSGVEVIAIDVDLQQVEKVKDEVSLAVCLDASQEEALKTHGIGEADVLIAAIGHDFEAQVLAVLYARQLGIPKIIARATTPDHAKVLEAVGVDQVVRPEEEAARLIVQQLTIPNITRYFELADLFSLVEVAIPEDLIGKTLRQLDLRRNYRVNLIAIKRRDDQNGDYQFNPVPEPDERLLPDDILIMVGSDLDLSNFLTDF